MKRSFDQKEWGEGLPWSASQRDMPEQHAWGVVEVWFSFGDRPSVERCRFYVHRKLLIRVGTRSYPRLVLTLNHLNGEMLPKSDSAEIDKHVRPFQRALEREERVRAPQLALAHARAEEVQREWQAQAELPQRGWQTQTLARTEEEARMEVRVRARVGWQALASFTSFTPTYGEVLADSKLMDIIYSIKLHHRHRLACILWRSSQKYWWLIQILVPITRLHQSYSNKFYSLSSTTRVIHRWR